MASEPTELPKALLKNYIDYADLAGNMNLRLNGNCILIQNCAKPEALERDVHRGRAWTAAGLKVLFLPLTEPEALQWSMRDIGKMAGVSLGSVKYVLEDLKLRNELVSVNGALQWTDRGELLLRWSREYAEKILPKIPRRRYAGRWNDYDDSYPAVWTGESAAGMLELLQGDRICFYRYGNINEMILRGRWQPDTDGII